VEAVLHSAFPDINIAKYCSGYYWLGLQTLMKKPPPALDCAHVIEFAIVDDTVVFEQRNTLNVGDEWLGCVPRLAVCRNLDETEYMVFHCNENWEVLGVAAGYSSVVQAKKRTERSYHGLAAKWVATGYTSAEVFEYVEVQFVDQKCSFCGRTPLQFRAVVGDTVRICNHCIDSFHEIIRRETKET
jgi:hypothetical protein